MQFLLNGRVAFGHFLRPARVAGVNAAIGQFALDGGLFLLQGGDAGGQAVQLALLFVAQLARCLVLRLWQAV